MEGNLCFKIDRASLIVGSKFTVFALFYFVFEVNFPSTSPHGAYIWRDDLMEVFLRYWFGGLIFGGAYIWRGSFPEFCDISCLIGFFHFQHNNSLENLGLILLTLILPIDSYMVHSYKELPT